MTNCALVVVDMLYDFIDGSLACQNAEEAVKQTLRFIDSRTEDVYYTHLRAHET